MGYFSFLLLFASLLCAQQDPKDYFRSPMDIPLQVVGNFAELRSNHFHAGLDFRTQQKEGLNIYACAEGYISRIKISPVGYGKALYVSHPNGYTTVYAHLSRMAPAIEQYLKKKQYEAQSYELDFFPAIGELTVAKGQIIAFSGNTGSSSGPHLHFEIRETKTEQTLNPLLFGFDRLLPDSKVPKLHGLLVYPLDQDGMVNGVTKPMILDLKADQTNSYVAQTVRANGRIGFSIQADDMDDNGNSANGLYAVSATFNGVPTFGFTFDAIDFEETRCINALIDYPRYKQTEQRFQRLFRKRPYPLKIVTADVNGGIITVVPNLAGNYKIELKDFFGNKLVVSIPVVYAPPSKVDLLKEEGFFMAASKDNLLEKDGASVFFPAGTFYEDHHITFEVSQQFVSVGRSNIPAHQNFTVKIPRSATDTANVKRFIAHVDGKRKTYLETTFKDGFYIAKTKNLGKFMLDQDTEKPSIVPAQKMAGVSLGNQRYLEFTIADGYSGIKQINAWLNGKWILFEYDQKSKRIKHDLADGFYIEGRNDLKLEVKDHAGNCAIFESYFFKNSP